MKGGKIFEKRVGEVRQPDDRAGPAQQAVRHRRLRRHQRGPPGRLQHLGRHLRPHSRTRLPRPLQRNSHRRRPRHAGKGGAEAVTSS